MNQPGTPIPVSLVQLDVRPLAPEENLEHMHALACEQARAGAKIIVFPELANTGYVEPMAPASGFSDPALMQDYALTLYNASEPMGGPYTEMLTGIARQYGVHLIAGLSTRHPVLAGGMYNTSLLVAPDGSTAAYHKIHRWHMEKLYYIAGDQITVQHTPFGSIGMQICYDMRFPELTRSMMLRGADIVTNIWASFRPADTPARDPDTFIHRAYTRAIENGVFVLSCNRAGRQGDFQFLGHSCVVAPDGTVLAASSSEEPDVIQAELDMSEVSRYRAYVGLLTDRRPDVYDPLGTRA